MSEESAKFGKSDYTPILKMPKLIGISRIDGHSELIVDGTIIIEEGRKQTPESEAIECFCQEIDFLDSLGDDFVEKIKYIIDNMMDVKDDNANVSIRHIMDIIDNEYHNDYALWKEKDTPVVHPNQYDNNFVEIREKYGKCKADNYVVQEVSEGDFAKYLEWRLKVETFAIVTTNYYFKKGDLK